MAKEKLKDEAGRPTPVVRDGPYVMMLFVTLVAIIAGCVLLYLDHEEYGGKSPPKEPELKIQRLGDQFKGDTGTSTPGGPAPSGPPPGGPPPGGPAPGGMPPGGMPPTAP